MIISSERDASSGMGLSTDKPSTRRAVCVIGMHRSGTSMVTELLEACDIYVGSHGDLMPPVAEDNAHGYFEHKAFHELNEDILRLFGGSWDNPPRLPKNWIDHPMLDEFRQTALGLIRQMEQRPVWAWKDPRTTITFPFWRALLTDVKVIMCVRHPEEVSQSFACRRGAYLTRDDARKLWTTYNQLATQVMDTENVLVTNYASHHYDARAELERIIRFIGCNVQSDVIARASAKVAPDLRHGFTVGTEEEDPLYQWLCERSGPVFERQSLDDDYQEALRDETMSKALTRVRVLEDLYASRNRELDTMRRSMMYLTNRLSRGEIVRWRVAERLRRLRAKLL